MSAVITPPRTYTYRTSTEWLGRRNGRLSTHGKESQVVSAPPEFRGEEGFWNPEELFVAAVESCLMMTFASMAEKYHLPVEAYYSEATGDLEYANGEYRFTRITIRPTIIINDAEAAPKTLQVLKNAERGCLLSNSVTAEVSVVPDLVMGVAE